MIKANEIRVNNMIQYNDYIAVVTNINKSTVRIDIDNELEDLFIDYESASSIPLTEEWLLKLGFYLNDNGEPEIKTNEDYALSISINCAPYKYTAWHVLERESKYYMMAEVKFVHQVQNLFYCLTGEELNYNA